jgi:hypothetical protein
MIRTWISARRTWILLAVALATMQHLLAQVFNVDLFHGLDVGSGLLLLWGIGHCDTLDGPVVMLAKKALQEKNVNFVLPWVRQEDEPEIRRAFDQAQAVRDLGGKARSLADQHFFETLVRVHRAGEGAPFSGLKPAGLDLGPAVPAADRALKTASPNEVIKILVDAVTAGVRAHFHKVLERQGLDPNDVAAGRRYVEAYVPYVHYVERLWEAATRAAHGHYAEHESQPHQAEPVVHQH